jgi:RNA polymerase sigma-70 factor (ECF subfamily)
LHDAVALGSDEALLRALRQLRAGLEAEAACRTLDRQLRPRLHAYFVGRSFSPEDAEDLVQETLARVYENVRQLREEERFLPWLFTIARNEMRRALARRQRQPALTAEGQEAAESLPDRSPEGALEAAHFESERLRAVQAAIDDLAPQQRQSLLLQVIHEMSYEEIAAILRLSVNTVRNHLAAARKGLRQVLADEITGGNSE